MSSLTNQCKRCGKLGRPECLPETRMELVMIGAHKCPDFAPCRSFDMAELFQSNRNVSYLRMTEFEAGTMRVCATSKNRLRKALKQFLRGREYGNL